MHNSDRSAIYERKDYRLGFIRFWGAIAVIMANELHESHELKY
jgi:hypothetical protein